LRATFVRIASDKTAGFFNLHIPFVLSCKWGGGNYQTICKRLSVDSIGQKVLKMSSEEDVSPLFEKLKVSPGGGLLSDLTVTIRDGSSDV